MKLIHVFRVVTLFTAKRYKYYFFNFLCYSISISYIKQFNIKYFKNELLLPYVLQNIFIENSSTHVFPSKIMSSTTPLIRRFVRQGQPSTPFMPGTHF